MPRGTWRANLTAAYGTFKTSHVASCPDVAPECSRIAIPEHEHRVRLDLFHIDLSLAYGLNERVLLSARLPYDVKDLEVNRTLDGRPFDPPYGDIHHRTQVVRGFSDGEVSVFFPPWAGWLVGAGLTLPFGKTEPDPIEAGRRGEVHQHIQFGSGTVDPKLSVQYARSLGRIQLTASVDARVALYENRQGFKAPATVRWSVGPSLPIGTTGLAAQLAGQYQSIGRWNGEVDEGTGFHNGGVFLRASFLVAKGWRVTPGAYREIYSESLSDESFRQGTTYSLVLSRFFH